MTSTDSLQHWLNIATQSNGLWAKTRIETEITAHYDKAFRVALESGQPEDVAGAMALKSLGNASEAQERFRKTHLTIIEERYLANHLENPKFIEFAPICIYFVFATFLGGLDHPNVMLSLALFGGVICWSERRLFRGHTRNLIAQELRVLPIFIYLCWPNVQVGSNIQFYRYATLFLFLYMLVLSYFLLWKRALRIIRKVPKQLSEEEMNLLHEVYNKGSVSS